VNGRAGRDEPNIEKMRREKKAVKNGDNQNSKKKEGKKENYIYQRWGGLNGRY